MLLKGRFSFFLIVFFFFSCAKEKRYQDYNENEFYEAQGIITKVYQTSSVFDESYNKLMDYTYVINDSVFLKGKEKEFYKAWNIGQPVVVLVHNKDSSISFYARDGIVRSFSEKQLEMFNTILEIDRPKK